MVELPAVLNESPVRVDLGRGAAARLARRAAEFNPRSIFLVADPAMRPAGHLERVANELATLTCPLCIFDAVAPNPTTTGVCECAARLLEHEADLVVALGGGSAMDVAKAANLVARNGGAITDYAGDPDPQVLARRQPLVPMIMLPTTAGTGSEAQSFALISDAVTHAKMACGDRRLPSLGGMRPRWAILDADLLSTAPRSVLISAGLDAIVHAIETSASTRRSAISRQLSVEAWRRLPPALENALSGVTDAATYETLLLGAHLAGAAIEFSMLGAAHACANPLTAGYGVTHGLAVAMMIPHVIAFNVTKAPDAYADLESDPAKLIQRVRNLASLAGISTKLREIGVGKGDLAGLARLASQQWTARFNPTPVGEAQLLEIYLAAWQ